jgi:dinuclear metal center YbgI/SA1388 family protein
MTIQDIYKILDEYAPFSLQESYDNSGLLAGDPQQTVKTVVLTLDITIPVIEEAVQKDADLILAHHPVIWTPLRSISPSHPVWHLVRHNIGAICSHTCFDIAAGGLNDAFGQRLRKFIPMQEKNDPLTVLSGERNLGNCADLTAPADAEALAANLKEALGCISLRYIRGRKAGAIRRIAWCTGSGGDLIQDAMQAGADALITGDCKHSVWAEAQNRNFTLFDCGHFETEVIIIEQFRRILEKSAPELHIIDSAVGSKPFFQTL